MGNDRTLAEFAATESLLVALVSGVASQRNAPTALQSMSEQMPSTTGLMPEANRLAGELLGLKPALPS